MKKTGVVSEVYPKMAAVFIDGDLQTGETRQKVLCTYRRAQVIERPEKHSASGSRQKDHVNPRAGKGMIGNRSQQSEENLALEWRERSPVAPGDRVEVRIFGSRDGVIEEVYPRRNCIQRRAPGREGKILHTIAANVDQVVIVSSYDEPKFSPGLVDRFLVATTQAQITPVLVINKMDLRSVSQTQEDLARGEPWKIYRELGVHCFPVSTKTGTGIDVLETFLRHKTSVFCGHSGVGKTSLLRELYGESAGRIGEISKATGKGKHTTTVSVLLETPDGTRFIDTPGIKEFGLHHINPENLIDFFPEIKERQLTRQSIQDLPRYENYLRIKAALEEEGR